MVMVVLMPTGTWMGMGLSWAQDLDEMGVPNPIVAERSFPRDETTKAMIENNDPKLLAHLIKMAPKDEAAAVGAAAGEQDPSRKPSRLAQSILRMVSAVRSGFRSATLSSFRKYRSLLNERKSQEIYKPDRPWYELTNPANYLSPAYPSMKEYPEYLSFTRVRTMIL